MNTKSSEDLLVWQKAHAFVLEIYRLTDAFPKTELFALTSQMRRARFTRRVSVLAHSHSGSPLRRHVNSPSATKRSIKDAWYLCPCHRTQFASTVFTSGIRVRSNRFCF